jgi:hypothetical protein
MAIFEWFTEFIDISGLPIEDWVRHSESWTSFGSKMTGP